MDKAALKILNLPQGKTAGIFSGREVLPRVLPGSGVRTKNTKENTVRADKTKGNVEDTGAAEEAVPAGSVGPDGQSGFGGLEAMAADYLPAIRRLVSRLGGWDGNVDDIVQDVFVAALKGQKDFEGKSSLKTWLYRITINTCHKHRYKRMLRMRFLSVLRDRQMGHIEGRRSQDTAAPDRAVRLWRIREAVRRLPARYREVVVLKYLEQMETEEICRLLGLQSAAVYTRLTRAKKILKAQLAGLAED